jgi:uncharacterized protein (UPF0297 family)
MTEKQRILVSLKDGHFSINQGKGNLLSGNPSEVSVWMMKPMKELVLDQTLRDVHCTDSQIRQVYEMLRWKGCNNRACSP